MILNAVLFALLSIKNITRDGFRSVMKWMVAAFPLLAIPLFFLTAIGSIILNDGLWNSAMNGVQFVQSSGAGAKGGFMSIYGKMNYFFPVSETLLMAATLVPIKVVCLGIRIVKSCIPTIG